MGIKDKKLFSLWRLLREAFGQYKFQILVLLVFGFISGLLEGIGVNALIPLFSFITGQEGGGSDFISRAIKSFFGFLHLGFNVEFLLIFIVALFVLKALITVFLNYVNIKISSDFEFKTRSRLFDNILKSNWPHLLKQKLGHLENVLMVDVQTSTTLLQQLGGSIMSGTSLLIYLLVAINISFYVTVITVILGLVFFYLSQPLISKIKALAYQTVSANKEMSHHVNENILGIKTVKAMLVEEGVAKKGRNYFQILKDIRVSILVAKNISSSFIQPFSLIFICVLFAYSYYYAAFSFAAMVAMIYLIQRIFVYVQELQRYLHSINESAPFLKSVLDYRQEAVETKEINEGRANFIFNDSLAFDQVGFAYNADKEIFSQISFSVKKGEMLGLIGPSGVGKTTLVDLILRLLDPVQGRILLDGQDIKEIDLGSWRKNIGYVSQDIFLTNDTIANNIKFYQENITDEAMIAAAKMANIYDFIESCPAKFDTVIGERGVLLSAGQRQRIVIARVLARKPQLLILDEATSALDNESEMKIQEVIKKLKGRVTVLAIAHRLSTLVDSDRLIALENGQIVEEGRPAELLNKKDSYFFKVYNLRN